MKPTNPTNPLLIGLIEDLKKKAEESRCVLVDTIEPPPAQGSSSTAQSSSAASSYPKVPPPMPPPPPPQDGEEGAQSNAEDDMQQPPGDAPGEDAADLTPRTETQTPQVETACPGTPEQPVRVERQATTGGEAAGDG